MPGLLDFLDSDEGRMGIGLLMAGSKRSDGAGFGQRLGESMSYVQAQRENDAKRRFQQVQMDNYNSEIEARKLAGVKDARQQAFIADYYNRQNQGGLLGGATSPGAFTPSSDGMGPTMPQQAAPIQNQRGQIASKTIDQIQEFKDRTGIDHMPAWKLANEGFERKPGTFVEMPGQAPRYIEDPTKGISFNNGVIGQMPGAENIARLEGQKALMTEMPKAMLAAGGRVNLRTNSDNTQTPVSEYTENPAFQDMLRSLGMPGGTSQSAPPAPPNRPMLLSPAGRPAASGAQPGYATEAQMKATMSGDMGANPAALAREIKAVQNDLMKPMDEGSKSQLRTHLADLQRQASDPRVAKSTTTPEPIRYGMTNDQVIANEAKRATIVDTAKADVQSTQGRQAGVDGALNAFNLVNQALAHPGLATATGLSGKVDPRNYIPGTDASNFDSVAKQLQGNAFLSAFAQLKGAGQITEVEGAKATAAIARLQQTQSSAEYKAALKDYQTVIGQGLKRMGVDPTQTAGGSSGDWGSDASKPAPPQAMKGLVRGGYKFKGGDPSDKNSWERM